MRCRKTVRLSGCVSPSRGVRSCHLSLSDFLEKTFRDARKFNAVPWPESITRHLGKTVRTTLPLFGFAERASIWAGGSRWGSKGNAVRVLIMLTRHAHKAAAAPATVSGEPSTSIATGRFCAPGKAVEGGDPRARTSATSNRSRASAWAGCPESTSNSVVVRSL
jgi:hypothetical protein